MLVRWDAVAREWTALRRFDEPGLSRITRLAVSPRGDRIALVGEEVTPR